MATRSARDNKVLNAKHSDILKTMLRRPENRLCVDCKRNDPRWASTNLGCFLCIRCSGIHRSMGVHISRIKSIDLDTWTPEQVALVQRWGNKRANLYWEAHLRPGHMPPDHKIESFIRSKYESRRWAMEGPLPDPDTLDDGPAPTEPAPSSTATAAPPKTAKPVVKPSTDLLGESPAPTPPPSAPAATSAAKPVASSSGGGLFDLDFSPEASSAAAKATAPAARKDVRNDILSLFASPSSAPAPLVQQQQQAPPPPSQAGGGLWSAGAQFGGLNTVPAAPVQTPAHAGVDGMSNHFSNISVGSTDPWGGFASPTTAGSAVPPSPTRARAQTRQSGQFGLGEGVKSPPAQATTSLFGGVSDPWASSAPATAAPPGGGDDLFGGFASGNATAPSGGGFGTTGFPKNDAFADIWK